ncbi:EcsC family protein [Paenibacillus pini]|uniref:EcsC protein n=1 Tax=Paenibacillus pini JCM 16418 TaxID=1236976 RepID=W7YCF4_9BACL|nr:EcsC family protein [Paenibacillus pini]GAF08590.1 hypothetical protein JCM16418_2674 [Paenibacillus pini JCM 16418]
MLQMESKEDLETELLKIYAWEKNQKKVWLWDKISRLPFMVLDRLTPKFIRDILGKGLAEVGRFIQTGGQYLVQQKSVMKRYAKFIDEDPTLEEVSQLPLAMMDQITDEMVKSRVRFAAAQGATTGVGGVFTLAADIPAVLGLSLKVLQEIALCYGYDPREEKERVFIVKCLQFASADIVGKKAVLEELAQFEMDDKSVQVISQIQGWREVVQTYRDSFGFKKLFQLVPVAGIVFGSISNKGTIEDVAEAGQMLYKKRRIISRLQH